MVTFSGHMITSQAVPTAAPAVVFHAQRGSDQTITSDTWTKVNLNAETVDSNGFFDSTTNFRFQPTIAGYYALSGSIATAAAATSVTLAVSSIRKNGTVVAYGTQSGQPTAALSTSIVAISALYMNGSTDYVELWGFMSCSGTPSLRAGSSWTCLSGHLIR